MKEDCELYAYDDTIKISSEQPCTTCVPFLALSGRERLGHATFRKIIAGYRLHSTLQAFVCESR